MRGAADLAGPDRTLKICRRAAGPCAMRPDFHLTTITGLDQRVGPLREEAGREGLRFVARLIDDWASASSRFDQPGEFLVGAVADGRLLGICGLNRDPHTTQRDIGRLRHLYVSMVERRRGIGRALVRHLLARAGGTFVSIRLRTTPDAAPFYERLGFRKADEANASHIF